MATTTDDVPRAPVPERTVAQPSGNKRNLLWLLAGLSVLVSIGFLVHLRRKHAAAQAQAAAGNPADRVVPVKAAPVQVADVPVYLDGLGSLVGSSTVVVRSQVDGRLQSVAFQEGQPVKKGDVLAQIDPRPFEIQLHTAQASQAKDEATLKNAELNLRRDQELVEKKLIAQQQEDDQAVLVAQSKAAIQADKAQIEAAQLNLSYARITSPIDGITGVRQVDPGNLIHQSDANGLVVVTQLDPIAVLFTLPQDVLTQVAQAESEASQPLEVELQNREGDQPLGKGKLLLVDNQINAATATIRLKALVDNPKHTLWPNQFVKARLKLSVLAGAKTIPASALQNGPQGQFVYVVENGSTVSARQVKVGSIQGETAVVTFGLQAGEQVVVDGQNQLKPGAKVSLGDKTDKSGGEGPGKGGPGTGGNSARRGGGRGAPGQGQSAGQGQGAPAGGGP